MVPATAAKIRRAIAGAVATLFIVFGTGTAGAVSLTVLPVIIHMAPGQMVAAMTVVNHGDRAIAFQVRPFIWSQRNNQDVLTPTNALLISPPLGTIDAGARQVIRLALRQAPAGRESSYRILLDDIPPPAAPGTVQIALRLSIPIFAEPRTRVAAQVQWQIETNAGQSFLVGINKGSRHEAVRDIRLVAPDGRAMKVKVNGTPYILAGATRRWRIAPPLPPLAPGATLRLMARTDTGKFDEPVRVVGNP